MSEVAVTELVVLDPERLDGVGTAANGTPFLLIKAAADGKEKCDTCDGSGKILAGKRECPDCKGSGEVAAKATPDTESAEADAAEDEVTGSTASKDTPGETTDAAVKGDVQDSLGGTHTPQEAGHLDTGQSGVSGSVTTGTVPAEGDSSQALGGRSTSTIPDEARVTERSGVIPNTTDGLGLINPQALAKAIAVSSLAEAIDQIAAGRQAIKDGQFPEATGAAAENPGSMPWESYDAATLRQIAECLAGCCSALDNLADRERTEANVANGEDMENAWDLEEAASALEYALGVAARLSYHEAAEGEATKGAEEYAAKVGRTLSGKNKSALMSARDHLSAVIDGAEDLKAGDAGASEEDNIVTTVTKGELAEAIIAGVQTAMKDQREAEEAEKNANNGGDVSTADIHPTATTDAANVGAVGGSVDAQYVNKGTETGEVPATDSVVKQVADQLEDLTKSLQSVEETVAKLAKRPRPGGPSLDGQARGLSPAAEGRLSDVAKGVEDGEIEQLTKQLAEATSPQDKDRLGMQLTRLRLTKMHENGQL